MKSHVINEGKFGLTFFRLILYNENMYMLRVVKTWTITLAGVSLMTFFPFHGNSVLCLSDIGHLEIEVAGSSCCAQDTEMSIPVDPLFAQGDRDNYCGSCVDVFFVQHIDRIANSIQAAPSNNASIDLIPYSLLLPCASICDQDAQTTFSFRDYARSPVIRSCLSNVIRC